MLLGSSISGVASYSVIEYFSGSRHVISISPVTEFFPGSTSSTSVGVPIKNYFCIIDI